MLLEVPSTGLMNEERIFECYEVCIFRLGGCCLPDEGVAGSEQAIAQEFSTHTFASEVLSQQTSVV